MFEEKYGRTFFFRGSMFFFFSSNVNKSKITETSKNENDYIFNSQSTFIS